MAPIFLLYRGHMQHVKRPTLSFSVPKEQAQQRLGVESVRLRTPRAPGHFDARGIHDQRRDPGCRAGALEPEAIPPGLIAQQHWGIRGQVQMLPRQRQLPK
jgi:hypothetical protein